MKNGVLVDDLRLTCETHISVKLRGAKAGGERKLKTEKWGKDENKQENKGRRTYGTKTGEKQISIKTDQKKRRFSTIKYTMHVTWRKAMMADILFLSDMVQLYAGCQPDCLPANPAAGIGLQK